MVLKTFNVEQESYRRFSEFCRDNGMSMSRQIDFFMKSMSAEEPSVRKEYQEKLNRIRNGRFIKVDDFAKRYRLPS